MTVRIEIHKGQKPTEEQIQEIKAAANLRPICDEDAPELSLEQLQQYGAAAIRKFPVSAAKKIIPSSGA